VRHSGSFFAALALVLIGLVSLQFIAVVLLPVRRHARRWQLRSSGAAP
jgi:hypothetical protein